MSVTTHASFLLEGNVSKRLAAFSAPLVAANLLQYVYQFVDMGIVGNVVGETGLVAVSNASAVVFIISSIAIGLMSGCTVVARRTRGRSRRGGTAACLRRFPRNSPAVCICDSVGWLRVRQTRACPYGRPRHLVRPNGRVSRDHLPGCGRPLPPQRRVRVSPGAGRLCRPPCRHGPLGRCERGSRPCPHRGRRTRRGGCLRRHRFGSGRRGASRPADRRGAGTPPPAAW